MNTRRSLVTATLLLVCVALTGDSQNREVPLGLNGYVWMQWTEDQRSYFMWGYVRGFDFGQTRLCHAVAAPLHWKLEEMSKCLELNVRYSKETDYYASEITAFYERYPEDRHIPVTTVLYLLSDGEVRSLQQIHVEMKGIQIP